MTLIELLGAIVFFAISAALFAHYSGMGVFVIRAPDTPRWKFAASFGLRVLMVAGPVYLCFLLWPAS
jgi:hypothetical protein